MRSFSLCVAPLGWYHTFSTRPFSWKFHFFGYSLFSVSTAHFHFPFVSGYLSWFRFLAVISIAAVDMCASVPGRGWGPSQGLLLNFLMEVSGLHPPPQLSLLSTSCIAVVPLSFSLPPPMLGMEPRALHMLSYTKSYSQALESMSLNCSISRTPHLSLSNCALKVPTYV